MDDVVESDEIIKEHQKLAFTRNIFLENYLELNKELEKYENDNDIWYVQNRLKLHEAILNVTRLLHNFLASIKTQIDHERRFRNKLKPEIYQKLEEKRMILIDEDVVSFMSDFREYIQHYTLPFTTARLSWKLVDGQGGRGISHQKMLLDKEKLLEWNKWKSKSKNYILKHDTFDIKERCKEYFELVSNYYVELSFEISKAQTK